jgi:MaoC like domain
MWVVGDEVIDREVNLTRTDLQVYAQASGDHNPIHLDDEIAAAVGLPGVIAHGMLTMGHVSRVVTEFVGSVRALKSLSVRFTRPVIVPPLSSQPNYATLHIKGTVAAVDEATGEAIIAVSAIFNGQTVLARAEARVATP